MFKVTLASVSLALTFFSTSLHAAGNSIHAGFSTDAIVANSTVPSLSMQFGLNKTLDLQTNFGISTVSPFNFGVGAVIKHTVIGDSNKGFHIGGGVGLGLTGAEIFFVNFLGNVGFHFNIVDGVLVAVDGGVGVTVVTQGGGANVRIGGNGGNLLGMSLLFRL